MVRYYIFIGLFYLSHISLAMAGTDFRLSKIMQSPQLQQELAQIVRQGMQKAYQRQQTTTSLSDFWKNSVTIFVTLKKEGKTRACMGSLHTQRSNMVEEIWHKLSLALLKDPQHRPVGQKELDEIEVYITEVRNPQLVSGIV